MISGIFLDLDGTLIDSLEDICGHLNRVRERHCGLPRRPSEELRPFIGQGVEHLVKLACPELPESELGEVISKFRASYLEEPQLGGSLYPGVKETLELLRAFSDLRLAVVTNKMSSVAEKTLAHYLPSVTFDAVLGRDRVRSPKPHPAHLTDAVVLVGADPSRSCMVGDHPVDRQCAESAGIAFLAAGYGFGGVEGVSGRILSAFSEILEHLPPFRV